MPAQAVGKLFCEYISSVRSDGELTLRLLCTNVSSRSRMRHFRPRCLLEIAGNRGSGVPSCIRYPTSAHRQRIQWGESAYRAHWDAISALPDQSLLIIFPIFDDGFILDGRSVRIRAGIADTDANFLRPVLLARRAWRLHRARRETVGLGQREKLRGGSGRHDDSEVNVGCGGGRVRDRDGELWRSDDY